MIEVKHELIPLTAPSRWHEVLRDIPHSFGHTWESCYAMSLTTGYPTFLYHFQDKETRIACPIAEREYNGHIDIVTPYGFSGFVGNTDYHNFQNEWKTFAQSKGYVCGYIGLNPLFENASYVDKHEVFENSDLYILNLELEMHQLVANLSINRKRQLKRYEDQKQHIHHNERELNEFFLSNYTPFFNQKQHASVYDLTQETLLTLTESENVFLNGIYEGKELKAVSMYGFTPYCAEYLFTISFERDLTFPLIWNAIGYLKSIGVPRLNLGGGVKKGDSIAAFKERFGSIKLPLKCLKQVYNHAVYETLNEQANADVSIDGYFPAYRNRQIVEMK